MVLSFERIPGVDPFLPHLIASGSDIALSLESLIGAFLGICGIALLGASLADLDSSVGCIQVGPPLVSFTVC